MTETFNILAGQPPTTIKDNPSKTRKYIGAMEQK
jgi:hypothetical protein